MFAQDDYGRDKQYTDLKAFKKALIDIREKALEINAIVAMPYKIGSHRGGESWDNVYTIIKKVFENSGVDVEIYRYDMK